MRGAFALQKLSAKALLIFFQQKMVVFLYMFEILTILLTNDIKIFDQLGPGCSSLHLYSNFTKTAYLKSP